ncbi:MMPL family transporter [Kitasatospora sp. A2-31]|uniref:MMPL family transporter n=1 Tax=Kitasatospora sp. A2-31 TaxID=2916414 RepID=UPI001EEAA264|nr:MMPL family transporter [Kitasatospora sp. A2-31]MCG6495739.1 MMPL family transporter [Kitasatospora sp. A2-31]
MLNRIADLTINRPKRVLLITLLAALAFAALGAGLTSRVTLGGFASPGTESARAAKALEDRFEQGPPNLVILVQDGRGVDAPEVAAAGTRLTEKVAAEPGVSDVVSYWTTKSSAMRGKDQKQALLLGRIVGDFDTMQERVKELRKTYSGTVDGLDVKLGGSGLMWVENLEAAADDSLKAEAFFIPVVLVLLVLIFGSLRAAFLPLAIAITTTFVVMGLLFAITFVLEIADMVTMITTFLGLGLAVDYSLLFITRYREELAEGKSVPDAVRTTMRTVGRTVLFSATTLAVALGSTMALPFTMFHSLALGSVLTGLTAAATTLTIVPAMLVWMGPDRVAGRRGRKRTAARADSEGFWHRLAMFVMRRPVPLLLAVLAFMMFLALPAKDMKARLPDEQILPPTAVSAQVATAIRDKFDNREQDTLQVVALNVGDPTTRTADIDRYARQLSQNRAVARVDALTGGYSNGQKVLESDPASARFANASDTYLSLVLNVDPYGDDGAELVRTVRDDPAPFAVVVGGAPADSVDTFDVLGDRLPIAIAILAVGSFVLLFLLTGSVLLPLKAILLSALSLSATFGALVYILQEGHLQWLVGDFVVTGALTWLVPITVVAIAFALSLDYAVFILSRITEEYRRTGRNDEAVAFGLERTGRVVTYAALLLAMAFAGLTFSSVSYVKGLGIGMPLAVLLDATLVRGVLVPAFMQLLGNANWWAPGPLRRFHDRFGISESDPDEEKTPVMAGTHS